MSFKKYQDCEKDKKNYFKEKRAREREYARELSAKLSIDPKDLRNPIPLPVDYDTFERIQKTMSRDKGSGSQTKSLGFGVGSRMPLSEKEKWVRKVELYNSHSEKTIDPKLDNAPSPFSYPLICHWPGKKPLKEKDVPKEPRRNFMKHITKGPSISPYYAHL